MPFKRSEVVTVISESTKNELQHHLNIENAHIEIIPNCVSAEFEPYQKKFNSECPRILQIGTKANKNIERVAAALEGLPCCLVVIGQLSDEQIAVLKTHAIDIENHVDISSDELVAQYHQADLVMFASLYEGFGLPILESNSVGRPVITSNLFSMPEVGGNAACYIDPYSSKEIRKATERIIYDTEFRNSLVSNGFQNVKNFTPESIAYKYATLYRKVHSGVI